MALVAQKFKITVFHMMGMAEIVKIQFFFTHVGKRIDPIHMKNSGFL
jgi:hypothetical protein